jgi:hypothetical protein
MNLGEFDRPVVKALVNPGIYRVNVSRRGYISRQVEVRLKAPGSEEKLNIILEPLRIEAVLNSAEKNLHGKNYSEAEELIRDVLALNPEHAHANLLYGLLELERGNVKESVGHLLNGIRGGDTLALPIRIQADAGEDNVMPAELIIDRNTVQFKAKTPGLNFSIARSYLQVSQVFNSTGPSPFVIVWGKADFHGRQIEPKLRIFSSLSSGNASSSECSHPQAGRSCRTDVEILQGMIAAWRG